MCLEVSISNVIPESLDICPQLHLKQISQSSGITLLIHTAPDRNNNILLYYSMASNNNNDNNNNTLKPPVTDKQLHVSNSIIYHNKVTLVFDW